MVRECLYVLPSVKPGESISWGSLHDKREIREYEIERGFVNYTGIRFTPIPYCAFGDYDNSTTTERSNHRVMREEFPWLVHVYGSHGSEMLGYLGETENQNPTLIEAIEKLDDYPIADEDDESELTMERESEAWTEYGCRGFADFLTEPHDGIPNFGIPAGIPLAVLLGRSADCTFGHDITYRDDDESPKARKTLMEVWFTVLSEYGSGETSRQEGGGGFYFDCDDWYRTIARSLEKRRVYQGEIERARSDPRAAALESQGREGREALIDLYLELELHAAAEHVRYAHYHRTTMDEVVEALGTLADAWLQKDDEDSYPDGDSLGGSRSL